MPEVTKRNIKPSSNGKASATATKRANSSDKPLTGATGTRTKKAKPIGKRQNGISPSTKKAIKVVAMMMIIAASVYVLIATISYMSNWSKDQSVLTGQSEVTSELIKNDAGPLGAIIGETIVGKWFGVFGVMLPISVIILSFLFVYNKKELLFKVVISVISGMVIWSTAAAYFAGSMTEGIFGSGVGGAYGEIMSSFTESKIGEAGTFIAILLLIIIWSLYTFPKSILFFGAIYELISKAFVALFSTPKKEKRAETQRAAVADGKSELTIPSSDIDKSLEEQSKDGEYDENNPLKDYILSRKQTFNSEFGNNNDDDCFNRVGEFDPKNSNTSEPVFIIEGNEFIEGSEEKTESNSTSDDVPFEFKVATDDERERQGTHRDEFKENFEITVSDNVNFVENNGDAIVTVVENDIIDADDIPQSVFDPTLELSNFKLPHVDLLENRISNARITEREIQENKDSILNTLRNFNIEITQIRATIGPTVTLYEIVPAPGVRISKIKNLEDDIALSLSALGIRIIAPIPGKGTIGIEVPNKSKEVVSMYSAITSAKFQESDADLPIVLGRTIQNQNFVIDLAKMPHMLVAGATGQGKSVGLNAIITSLLYKKHPSELKFVMIDPKKVELSLYASLENYYLAKMEEEPEAIITDTQRVIYTLNSLCMEMEERYELLKMARMKSIQEYNAKFKSRSLNPKKGHKFLPYIVVIIDEFADLIMTAGKEIEIPIARIAQLARAVGIHLVIATQRPTINIITGVIKANFPARIAFRVISSVDSKTILDQTGANQLIGRGDMLVSANNEIIRVQCAFVDTPEVEAIIDHISSQTGLGHAHILPDYVPESKDSGGDDGFGRTISKRDALFEDIARYVVSNQQGSASTIQRNFNIGFNRAGRIMDQLERSGIVGKQHGSKPRDVRIQDMATLELMLHDLDNPPF